jgi:hypothetical protein
MPTCTCRHAKLSKTSFLGQILNRKTSFFLGRREYIANAQEQTSDANENIGHAESLICISGSTWWTPGNKPYHQTSLFLHPFSFLISSTLCRDGAPKVTAEALPRSWRREDAEAASNTLTARDGAAPGTVELFTLPF